MFPLLCPFVALVVSHFGFEGRTSVLVASVPGHCLPFPFSLKSCSNGMRISCFEHGFCCLKMASRMFDSSFKQLYAYIFMEDLAHDISESSNAHTYAISYAHNSYRCAQKMSMKIATI